MEEVADRRSYAPMHIAMEMETAVTPIAMETAGETSFKPMERNENGKQRRRSDVPGTTFTLQDWKSRM
jgi:hypothetical protein